MRFIHRIIVSKVGGDIVGINKYKWSRTGLLLLNFKYDGASTARRSPLAAVVNYNYKCRRPLLVSAGFGEETITISRYTTLIIRRWLYITRALRKRQNVFYSLISDHEFLKYTRP